MVGVVLICVWRPLEVCPYGADQCCQKQLLSQTMWWQQVLRVVCFSLPLSPKWCNPVGEVFLTKCALHGAEPQTVPLRIPL